MAKPILYSYWRSSCSWRVRIALNLKGIDYEYKTVNLLDSNALNAPDFVTVTPIQKVPVFIDNGHPIAESLAIIEYLEDKYPNKTRLLPTDPLKRAEARAIALHVTAGIQPLQNLAVLKHLNSQAEGKGKEFATHFLTTGLTKLEDLVKKSAGKYCVGDEVSIADLVVPSILYNANRFGVNVSQFPTLLRINESLGQIKEFKDAEPDAQPDANLNA
ncbi:unnamed protein product [Auanema sp. JU1783]|nr:unnamed protein product [Auanema sp. JU1783]